MARAGRLLVLAALLAGCRTVPLEDPIPVACTPRPDVASIAVRRGLTHEGFEIVEETPGRTRARLQRNRWEMVVDVRWDRDVEIRYVSSESLGFDRRDGVRYIHHGYNERARRLAGSIAEQSRIALAEVDPDAFLGPPVAAPPPARSAR